MVKKITLLLLLYIGNTLLWAADADAVRVYDEGFKAYQAGDYYKAANLFEDVRILADSPTIKANALRALVNAWKMSGMPYREFKAIETLLSDYPEFANFKELVLREYELGKAYYDGLREPAYWHFRWVPWLYGDNKCAEIYTAALKRAPFNPEAPGARLRLAHIYDEAGKIKSSLEQYRIILRDFPESEASRYAMLALANGLLILSRQGDGDGKHISEVHDLLLEFRKKYPKAKELSWVDRQLILCRNIQAKRHYEMALYYNKNGKTDAARRYLAIVLRDYPESQSAPDAEKLLVELDNTFTPGDFIQPQKDRPPQLKRFKIPQESPRVLQIPGKNHPYLVPVPDYSDRKNPIQEKKK